MSLTKNSPRSRNVSVSLQNSTDFSDVLNAVFKRISVSGHQVNRKVMSSRAERLPSRAKNTSQLSSNTKNEVTPGIIIAQSLN